MLLQAVLLHKKREQLGIILSVNNLGTSLLIVKAKGSHILFCRRYWTFFRFDSPVQRPELNNGF